MKASTQSSNEAHTSDLRSAPARPGICAAEARRNIWSVLETPLERFTAALLAAGDLLLSESELLSGILGYGYRARKRLALDRPWKRKSLHWPRLQRILDG